MNKAPLITPYVSLEIKDDILYVTYLPGSVITLDITKDIINKRLEYTDRVPYPLVIMGEGLRSLDKESRDYSSKQGSEGVLAGALLVNSVYTEFFGNFFLRITQPQIPAKLFTNEQEALKWLEQYKPKS